MKFFFPDSQDLVDPSFDFGTETRAQDRLRHRDDLYAHEVFSTPAYDGLLVSKGIVDGFGPTGSRYSIAQRHRLLRVGAKEFFRLENAWNTRIPVMGDCGAFTYVKEKIPPYTVDQVINFYVECQFDLGIAVDHVILDYRPEWDAGDGTVPVAIRERQEITLQMASDFINIHRRAKLRFEALGVAQGWSPASYAESVAALQKMGYSYIAIGGMVPLKTRDILASLEGINNKRSRSTRLHLLGVTRVEELSKFTDYGVVSFDSTAPLRQAFKDAHNNYYAMNGAFTAVRVPQVEGNPSLQKKIRAGQVSQPEARKLEQQCLRALGLYDKGESSIEEVLSVLSNYEKVYDPSSDHTDAYREVLQAKPWMNCGCDVCRSIGYHVLLFRGAERNRRRGFHNIWMFYRRLAEQIGHGERFTTAKASLSNNNESKSQTKRDLKEMKEAKHAV